MFRKVLLSQVEILRRKKMIVKKTEKNPKSKQIENSGKKSQITTNLDKNGKD